MEELVREVRAVAADLAARGAYWAGQMSGVPTNTSELAASYSALATRLIAACDAAVPGGEEGTE